jgi:hypothetical protein
LDPAGDLQFLLEAFPLLSFRNPEASGEVAGQDVPDREGQIALGWENVATPGGPPAAFGQPMQLFLRGPQVDAGPALHHLPATDPENADPRCGHVITGRGIPSQSPRWVPRALQRKATISPSAKRSLRVIVRSGKAER